MNQYRARLDAIERRMSGDAGAAAGPSLAHGGFVWPDGSGPHPGLPPVDLRACKVTLRDGWTPPPGHLQNPVQKSH